MRLRLLVVAKEMGERAAGAAPRRPGSPPRQLRSARPQSDADGGPRPLRARPGWDASDEASPWHTATREIPPALVPSEAADAAHDTSQAARLAELRVRLAARLAAAPAADAAFAVDLLTCQTREIWDLRLALRRAESAALASRGARQAERPPDERGHRETEVEQMEKRLLASMLKERKESELCQELAAEARRMAQAANQMERRDRAQRKMLEEQARCIEECAQEEQSLQAMIAAARSTEAQQVYALRVEARALESENAELSRALGQQPDAGPWLSAPAPAPWRSAGRVFDLYATDPRGEGAPRVRPAEFGHICEALKRHQGRGPTAVVDRRGFAEFAFLAVFGGRSPEVDRDRFCDMFAHVAENLEELEITYAQQRALAR